ncbi:MAG: DoxX family membrane protein [Candidatus Paceibacterota bacterium]|jgi:uncharacterized membrane protein YphA (DoxX/SURF4 family)
MKTSTRKKFGVSLLRLGLAGVFLWFGFSQLFDSLSWVGLVPVWAIELSHLPPAMIVMGNGIFEVVFAGLLAMGFFVRFTSYILGLHLLVIALDFGLVATGIRDFGLVIASFALSLMYTKDKNVLESVRERNII